MQRLCRIFRNCFFAATVAYVTYLLAIMLVALLDLNHAASGAFGAIVYTFVGGLLLLLILWNFTKIFNDAIGGPNPFSEKQADCLCAIAVIAFAYFALDAIFSFGFVLEPMPEIGFGVVANDGISEPTINLNIGMLVFSAIMYSLSAIFRYAALLQQLSDDTV